MAKRPNDDLFQASTMSFGEHLEELRTTLVRALIGLMIGFGIGLLFANQIVEVIQDPLKRALGKHFVKKAEKELIEKYGDLEIDTPPEDLELIVRRGLVPEFINVEPRGFIQAMKIADPERFEDLQFVEHRFFVTDIAEGKFVELCKRLQAAGSEDDNPAAAEMWKALPAEMQTTVTELGAKSELSEEQQAQVVAALNHLVTNSSLHQTDAFADLEVHNPNEFVWWNPLTWKQQSSIAEARQQTIESLRESLKEEENDDASRRLNKFLIAEALPEQINRPEKKFVQIPIWKPSGARVTALGAHEVFMIWLKAGFVGGLVISSPWIFWQIWLFVGAGLYPHEKKYVHVFLPISLALFLSGVALAFIFVFDPVLDFLFSFNLAMNIDPDPRISEWIGFVLFLPLGFGVAFQLPLVMLFVNRLGLISLEMYVKHWRIAILVIFVLSMLLTPADPISMLLMAVPLTCLYFLGIGMCKWMPHFRSPFADEGLDPT